LKKATHVGSCQCCGNEQKLPKDVLSLHGYDVRWGFFNGICRGAGYKPYEQDCSLIQKFIDSAKETLAMVEVAIEKALVPATEHKCWYHEYRKGSIQIRSGYVWREVEVVAEFVKPEWLEEGQEGWWNLFYINYEGKKERFGSWSAHSEQEILDTMTKQNTVYVERHLALQKKELERYIAWQQERVDTWVLKELKPVPPPQPPDPNRKPRRRRRW